MQSLRSGRGRTPVEKPARNTRATRSKSVESTDQLDLSTLVEDDAPEDLASKIPTQFLEDEHRDGEEVEDDKAEEPQGDSRFSLSSAMSGTTAMEHTETQTLHDPEDLDADIMLMSLPSLHSRSQVLIRHLTPNGNLEELFTALRNPRSSKSRVLENLWTKFESEKKDFCSGDYIRIDVVSRALFNVESVADITPGTKRPDALLYQANLATLAKRIASIAGDGKTDAAWEILDVEDGLFPRYFMQGYSADDQLPDDTLRLGVEIRTQMAIAVLRNPDEDLEDLDLDQRLESVFCLNGENYRGWGGLGIPGPELPAKVQDMIAKRVDEIKTIFHTSSIEHLEQRFPWKDFVSQLLRWIGDRNVEHETMVKRQGGPEALQSALRKMLDGGSLEEEQAVAYSQTGSADNEPNFDALAEFANENRTRLSGRAVSTQEEPPKSGQSQLDDQEPEHSEEAIALFEKSQRDRAALLQRAEEERATRQKENVPEVPERRNFIDPQKDAQRVSFDESQTSQAIVTTKTGFKRPRLPEDEDAEGEDDDEAFITDERQIQAQAEKRRLAKRPRREPSVETHRSDPEAEPIRPRPDLSQQLRVARQLARRTNTGTSKKRDWTEEEVKQLNEGMARYGHTRQRYADIKRWDEMNGNILEGRTVVNLKDKAVNIVKALLNANPNASLPPGFEHIPLGQYHAKQIRGYDWTTENTVKRRQSEADTEEEEIDE
ncbi:hypothetical protein K490DRAFT_68408 [Saccharata proteae CBS 121410]|uniref:Myb-like domain-containing protein n=1 Tax=Saccharata proteae CBS 121410 TaxID=1314787 RepID=A0A9P4HNA3_9PEZI|nr:hypothetical protein K490DRAFT_68408 [Saccharata proteae CBS 121410]